MHDDDHDPLRAARGILAGLALSATIYTTALLILTLWWLR